MNGPGASDRNTHCHPIACASTGSIRIDTIVSRKPTHVCSVRAVPT
jgi:hypothetical protein